jgi:hypothetical protein
VSRDFSGGGGNYLETTGSPAALNIITFSGAYSMAAFVKIDNTAAEMTALAKYNGFGPILRIISKKVRFFTIDGGAGGSEAVGATDMTDGTWQLIGGAWNGSSTQRVILDGVQDGFVNMANQNTGQAADWRIGERPAGGQEMQGLIYYIAIWSSYLSDSDWVDLAAGDCPDTISPGTLVGFWILEGDSPELDLSGNGNDMTVNGTTFDADEPTTNCGVAPILPVNDVPPVVSGSVAVGETLSTSDGSWTNADSFTYQWESSVDGLSGWSPISGETSNTILLTGSELDLYVRCVVTGTNGDGSTDANSNVVGPVLPAASVTRFSVIA